jgi:AcrR family transcriptional regulator
MNPEARREMIVRTALPLVAELGAGVTTQQIARAAGIGEATIFRAFEDKAALLRACMQEAVRPEHLEETLQSISPDQSLEYRLTEAAEALAAHSARVGAVVEALIASGMTLHRDDPQRGRKHFMASREAAMARVTGCLADLIRPDAHRLRVPVELAAHGFQYFVLSLMRSPGGWAGPGKEISRDAVAAVVDLFLHGALASKPEELSQFAFDATILPASGPSTSALENT